MPCLVDLVGVSGDELAIMTLVDFGDFFGDPV